MVLLHSQLMRKYGFDLLISLPPLLWEGELIEEPTFLENFSWTKMLGNKIMFDKNRGKKCLVELTLTRCTYYISNWMSCDIIEYPLWQSLDILLWLILYSWQLNSQELGAPDNSHRFYRQLEWFPRLQNNLLMRTCKHKILSFVVLNMAKHTIISFTLVDFVSTFFVFNMVRRI